MGIPRGMPSDRIPSEDPQPVPHRRTQAKGIAIAIVLIAVILIAVLFLL